MSRLDVQNKCLAAKGPVIIFDRGGDRRENGGVTKKIAHLGWGK